MRPEKRPYDPATFQVHAARPTLFQKLSRAFLAIVATEAHLRLQEMDAAERIETSFAPPDPRSHVLALPFKSKELAPGETQRIDLTSQLIYRMERLMIDNPEGWLVLDVLVGKSSQFVSPGPFPAEVFSRDAVGVGLACEGCTPGMILSIVVQNDGNAPGVCSGIVLGLAVM